MTAKPRVVTEAFPRKTLASTFIVTGGNTGLGFECASALATDRSLLVVVACRDVQQGEDAAQRARDTGGNVKVLPLDLSKQASIHAFVEEFRKEHFPPLTGLVCNAGSQNVGAPTKTQEGYEMTFAVNHLGHYLLSRLLLTDLESGARITFVASGVHDPKQKTGMPEPHYSNAEAVAHDFEPTPLAGRRRYTTSKLCNIYCTHEFARRFAESTDPRIQSLRINAFDPGFMGATGLARTYSAPLRFLSKYILPALSLFKSNINSPAKSGKRLALLASGSEGSATGKYFSDGREIRSSVESYSMQNQFDLWSSSARMTGLPSAI